MLFLNFLKMDSGRCKKFLRAYSIGIQSEYQGKYRRIFYIDLRDYTATADLNLQNHRSGGFYWKTF